jgi:hypothetical protein
MGKIMRSSGAFTGRYAGEWLREKSERESVSEYRGGKRAKRR